MIKVGVIGLGVMGGTHIGAYARAAAAGWACAVTAVCDEDAKRRAGDFPGAANLPTGAVAFDPKSVRAYADPTEMFADREIDLIDICTPTDSHVDLAIAALRAGKHVYCEKPVGITPASIAELVKVARTSDRVFQVGQQLRSNRRMRQTVARIHEGVCGNVVMIKAQRHAGDDLPHDASSSDWFFDVSRSGDVIVEMSVHNLDICNWVAQDRPDSAAGYGGALIWPNDPPGRTNMDGYTLGYEYRNGIKLSYTQTFFHPNGMPGNGQYWYVYGTSGGVDLMNSMYYPRQRGASPQKLVEESQQPENLDLQHVMAFYETIRTGAKSPADLTVGVNGALTAILGRDAIYRKTLLRWADLGVLL